MAEPSGTPPPASTSASPPAAAEEAEPAAWAEVQARWDEPAAHRAYLARFPDLDGLATAGRRYRDALAARPGDTVALAMKGEVLKRATVVGLSMLPRASPPSPTGGRWRRVAAILLASWLGSTLAWLLWKIFTGPLP